MSLQQLFTSRKPYDAITYRAQKGVMFYDESSGVLRIGDGVTPGGRLISYPIASQTTIGGVKLGPGTLLNGQGQLIIDSTGLPFSFGDFYAFANTGTQGGACLSVINANEDINIVSNGTGNINVVGLFHVHKTNNNLNDELSAIPIFAVNGDGQVAIKVPLVDLINGAVQLNGDVTGNTIAPAQPGVMLHVTGLTPTATNYASRIYNDAQNNLAAYVGRRYNGTASAPTSVKNNDIIMRISAVGYGATAMPQFGSSRIAFVAAEDYTDSAQGGRIEFYTNPLASSTLTLVASVTNASGITSTKFTGPLIGNVTGTATTATYAQSFNTSTLVANAVSAINAVTATNVINAVTSLTAGYDVTASSNTGSVTLSRLTSYSSSTSATYTLDFTGPGTVYLNPGNVATTIYMANYVAGRKIVMFIVGPTGPTTITVANAGFDINKSFNGKSNFKVSGGITMMTAEFYSTGVTTSSVFLNVNGAQ